MDLVAAVVADEQSFVVVEPGEGALDDPADAAEPGAVSGFAACDHWFDAALAHELAVFVVVVAAVGDHGVWPTAWPPDLAAYRRHTLQQRDELGDVVAVSAGDREGERDPRRVYEKVMLGA